MTKRLVFAPTRGSANPSGYLLEVLEDTTLNPALRYLAYLDLCMVSETDSDTWRRAALFETSGETYKRVIAVCLSSLEQLRLALNESNEQPFYELQVNTFTLKLILYFAVQLTNMSLILVGVCVGSSDCIFISCSFHNRR